METMGSRLKSARTKVGMTQNVVAKKLGISFGTLSGYERNYRDPDTETLSKLAEMYGVSVSWLVTGKHEQLSELETKILQEIVNLDESVKKEILKFIRFQKSNQ
jgi:transcriptional regulator with XRE-family HTH domain